MIYYGYFLIEINSLTQTYISYFIALLLCIQHLKIYSLLLEKIIKLDPLDVDNLHFHQLLFYFKKKIITKKFSNPPSLIINIYNFSIFLLVYHIFHNKKTLLFLILLNVTIYLLFYFYQKKLY